VGLTLGCSRSGAFWRVVLPEARRGIVRAFTEVLSSSVYLLFTTGDLDGAVAVSLLMIGVALVVLLTLRLLSRGKV
jgi:molybdate transport system permease protein